MYLNKYCESNRAPEILTPEPNRAGSSDLPADGGSFGMIEERDFSGHVSALLTHQGPREKDEYVSKYDFVTAKAMAQDGDREAQHLLGLIYGGGIKHCLDVPRDDTAAAEWLQKAADQGHATAMKNLAMYYQLGLGGVSRDLAKASELRLRALKIDHPYDIFAKSKGKEASKK